MSKKPVTQIKGDPEQTIKQTEIDNSCLERELNDATSKRDGARALIASSIASINQARATNADILQTRSDRISFLRRAISAAETDQQRFQAELRDIESRAEQEKQCQNAKLEKLRLDFNEVESELKARVHGALQQLKNLREFQEHRHILDQQKRQLTQMIADEKKKYSDELSDIHRRLVEQREFYEQDLREKLAAANQFVDDYADLHMDLVTQKIAAETKSRRDEMRDGNASDFKLLTDNESLRKQATELQRSHQIRAQSVKVVEGRATKMKAQADEIEARMNSQGQDARDRLRGFREETEFRITELTQRVKDLRDMNVELKQKTAIAAKDLAAAEESRFEHMKKEYELVTAMNDAAVFVLTSLDKVADKEDEEIKKKKSALNQIVQILATIEKKPPVAARAKTIELKEAEVQTEKPCNPLLWTGKIAEPPSSARVANPRLKASNNFKRMPEYRRVYELSARRQQAYGSTVFYKRK